MKRILNGKRVICNKLFVLLIALFYLLFLNLQSFAATKTSAGTGNWSAAATWSPAGVPASGDDVIIHSGNVVTIDSNYTCHNLYLGDATSAATTLQITTAGITLKVNGDLKINPSNINKTFILNAGPGTINVAGTFSTWCSTTGTNSIRVSTGAINFSPAVTIASAKQDVTFTGAGAITFNSSFTDQYNKLVTFASCVVNFNSSYIVNTTAANWAAKGTANFGNGSSITPTANITFNAVQINLNASATLNSDVGTPIIAGAFTLASGSTFTANMNFEVGGDWTNNGGTLSGGSTTVTLNGAANVVTGSASTSFPTLQIGRTGGATAASYTINTSPVCDYLIINGSTVARTLTISAGDTLTVNNDVTVNQPGAAVTSQLAVNAGTCNVGGNLIFSGVGATATWVGKVAVTSGTFNLNGTVTWMSNTAVATEVITVSTGTINFGSSITMGSNSGTLSVTSTGTINFNGTSSPSFNFGGAATVPVFTTTNGCTVNFYNGFTNNTNALTLAASSNTYFTGNGSITSNAALTFGNVQVNTGISEILSSAAGAVIIAGSFTLTTGSTFTANMNFEVGGDWTNNGGTLSGGSNTVTLNGAANVITGSASTSFPTLQIGRTGGVTAASYTMNISNTCDYLIFDGSTVARTLSLGSDVVFTINSDVTINQPTANTKTNSLSVNTATCNVGGNLIFAGVNATASRIAQVLVTSGAFSLNGTVTWMSNTAVATEVITVSTGTINFGSSITMGSNSGTLSVTNTGTINFNGTSSPSFNFGGAATVPVFTTTNGCTVNFYNGFTNNTNALTLAASSNTYFTGNGSITSNAALTFGNVQVNTGISEILSSAAGAVIIAGSFTLTTGSTFTANMNFEVTGDWINNGGSLSGGANTVILNGTANVIDGTTSTSFPTLQIGRTGGATASSYTMNVNSTCNYLTFNGSTVARALSLGSGVTLTVNNDVTINQPTANTITNTLNVNAGTCNVSGNLIYLGANATITRVAQVAVTSGIFTLSGTITWMLNTVCATEVITVSTGTVNFSSSITMPSASGTIQVTDIGTINFNGTTLPSLLFGGATAPVLTTISGSTVHFEKGFTSVTTSLSFASGSIVSVGSPLSANDLTIGNGITVTNNGTTIIYGNLTSAAASTFVNAANATLELRGNVSANVTLTTSASGNIVKYKGAGAQTIKPIAYYNLTLDSAGTKSLGVGVSVNNDLTVQGAAAISNSTAITVTGNFIYSSSASSTLGSNIIASGVILSSGTLNDGGNTITVNNSSGWTRNGGAFITTGTVIFGGSTPSFIAGSLPTTFNNLIVTNSGGVTLNVSPASATIVSGMLTLTNGVITTTSSNILKLTAAASSSSGSVSSYINGPMVKVGNTAFTFPVGKSGKWMRVGASGMSTSTTEVTAEYFASGNANLNSLSGNLTQVAPSEYWVVDRAVTADPVKLRFYWEDASSSSIFNCTYLTIAHYTGGIWKEEPSTTIGGSSCAGSGSGSIEMNGTVSSFSPFGFGGSGGIALPIKLVTFNATTKEKIVETDWTTEIEINNDYFTVERSSDGNNFTEIAHVNGAGNSTVSNTYKAIDENPLSGTSYYRLRQTDYDGHTSYSDIVPVIFGDKGGFSFYPNPVEKELFIRTLNTLTDAELNIYDMIGNKVYVNSIHQTGGTISVPIRGILSSGVYLATLISNGNEYKEKIVVR